VPPASVFPVLGLVFGSDRYCTVTKDERSSTLLLTFVEPHVHIAVERTGGGDLELGSPADPVDSVLMGVPLVEHSHVIFLEHDVFSILLSTGSSDEGLGCLVGSALAHLLLLGLKGLFHLFLGRV
jgi:hypothetical protein